MIHLRLVIEERKAWALLKSMKNIRNSQNLCGSCIYAIFGLKLPSVHIVRSDATINRVFFPFHTRMNVKAHYGHHVERNKAS